LNKEDILKRVEQLRNEEIRYIEIHAQIVGAIRECEYWLSQIEKEGAEMSPLENPTTEVIGEKISENIVMPP